MNPEVGKTIAVLTLAAGLVILAGVGIGKNFALQIHAWGNGYGISRAAYADCTADVSGSTEFQQVMAQALTFMPFCNEGILRHFKIAAIEQDITSGALAIYNPNTDIVEINPNDLSLNDAKEELAHEGTHDYKYHESKKTTWFNIGQDALCSEDDAYIAQAKIRGYDDEKLKKFVKFKLTRSPYAEQYYSCKDYYPAWVYDHDDSQLDPLHELLP